MDYSPISQRSFLKGLDASTSKFNQPPGSLPRLSNLLLTRRGSLITCDGTSSLSSQLTPAGSSKGSIVAIQQFLQDVSVQSGGSGVTNYPSTVATGGGGEFWVNPNNIKAADGLFASVNYSGPGTDNSQNLSATGYGFNIPGAATILGIVVTINRYRDNVGGGAQGNVSDNTVQLLKAGVATGNNKANGTNWPYAATSALYGSSSDLWGAAWAPADINAANFGVVFQGGSSTNNQNGSMDGFIDYISITVYYSVPAGQSTPTGQTIFYLQDPDPGSSLAEVTGLIATSVNVGGGTLTPGNTYNYTVCVLDGRGNASSGASTSIMLANGNNAVQLTWNVVNGAGSYLVLGRTGVITSGMQIVQVAQPDYNQNSSGPIGSPTQTYTDKGTIAPSNIITYGRVALGTNNTIGATRLFTMNATSSGDYFAPVQLALFPCRALDSSIPNIPPIDASGGYVGAIGQVPQMVQFAGFIVIALGNGWTPQYSDGTTVFPFTNTFTAQYITWAAATTYLVGDLVIPPTPNGHFYKCTQQGLSQTPGPPAFSTTTGQSTVDGQASWVEAGLVTTSPFPPGAAHEAFHSGSLWVLNTQPSNTSSGIDGPSALRMCDVGNIKSWNPLNVAFIGKDDGTEGMGLASFTISELGIAPLGSLLVFKNFSTYQVVGVFGSPNFSIQQLQTNMGCVAPRSIKFISGYGVMRFSHLGFALTDGVRDRLVSEPIRPYIFGTPASGPGGLPAITGIDLAHTYLIKGDEIVNPPLYAAAAPLLGNTSLSRLFLYDLVLRAWIIIDLPVTSNPTSFISSIYQIRTPGQQPITVVGGYDDNSIQIIQNGAASWNLTSVAAAVSWAFTTPEVFNPNDPAAPLYINNLIIRGINTTGNVISVTINLQTEAGYLADNRTYNIGTGEFELMVGVHENVLSANALISGTGIVEIESATWRVAPRPAAISMVIS